MTTTRRSNRDSLNTRGMIIATALVVGLGGFIVPVVGWFAGIVMMWLSPAWTSATKWTVTLIAPVIGAIVAASSFWAATSGLSGWHLTIIAGVLIAPLASGAWLLWRGLRP